MRIGGEPIEPQVDFVSQRGRCVEHSTPIAPCISTTALHQGRAGYEVIRPLRIGASSRYVLVKRGWVAAGPDRSQLPEVVTPAGEVDVEGMAMPANPPVFELSQQVQAGKLWQNVTVDRYRSQFALDLQPIIIQQHNELATDWCATGDRRARASIAIAPMRCSGSRWRSPS